MNNIIIENLEEQIKTLTDELSNYEAGSVEYKSIVSTINTMYEVINKDRELRISERKVEVELRKTENEYLINEKKIDNELLNNREQRSVQQLEGSAERNVQLSTLNDSKTWNAAKTCVEVAGIVAPLVFYGIWMKRGLKFEEEGCLTSTTFKGLIGKFKPTK